METPILSGKKRSSLYFNKIDIYKDRMEQKGILMPKKIIYLKDILYWTEVNKRQNPGNISWTELTVYTEKTKYTIMTLHWDNYQELKQALTNGKTRNLEMENKIYNSF